MPITDALGLEHGWYQENIMWGRNSVTVLVFYSNVGVLQLGKLY